MDLAGRISKTSGQQDRHTSAPLSGRRNSRNSKSHGSADSVTNTTSDGGFQHAECAVAPVILTMTKKERKQMHYVPQYNNPDRVGRSETLGEPQASSSGPSLQEFKFEKATRRQLNQLRRAIPETDDDTKKHCTSRTTKLEMDYSIGEAFLQIQNMLCQELNMMQFSDPITHIYNPLDYASAPHRDYVMKYGCTSKKVLFLGMNPGPFGMAQTGVPFGEVNFVRDWLCIEGAVGKPAVEHPKRPIQGLGCTRSEVSGARLWGFIRGISGSPEVFFKNCFMHNICPLVFMTKTGKNVTPPQIPAATRKAMNRACDRALCQVVRLMSVEIIVGVGKFAQQRAQEALSAGGIEGLRIECIMHPSPANPAANKGWDGIAEKQLRDLDLLQYMQPN